MKKITIQAAFNKENAKRFPVEMIKKCGTNPSMFEHTFFYDGETLMLYNYHCFTDAEYLRIIDLFDTLSAYIGTVKGGYIDTDTGKYYEYYYNEETSYINTKELCAAKTAEKMNLLTTTAKYGYDRLSAVEYDGRNDKYFETFFHSKIVNLCGTSVYTTLDDVMLYIARLVAGKDTEWLANNKLYKGYLVKKVDTGIYHPYKDDELNFADYEEEFANLIRLIDDKNDVKVHIFKMGANWHIVTDTKM